MKPTSILFVCMGNICRSPMAEGVFPNPYYGGDKGFEHVIDLLEDACENLFSQLIISSTHHHIITSSK